MRSIEHGDRSGQKLRRVKTDYLDSSAHLLFTRAHGYLPAVTGIDIFLGESFSGQDYTYPIAFGIYTGLVGLRYGAEFLRKSHLRKKDLFADPDLGYSVGQFRYRGRELDV